METPSSILSQTGSLSQKSKNEVASLITRNNGNLERPVLQDITNDSPINGVATEKTPFTSAMKYLAMPKKTPGSGEALLRGQVKILLEKVEEGAELVNKLSNRQYAPPFPGLGILPISPGLLAAPTPANTPQIFENAGVKDGTDSMEDVRTVLVKVDEPVKHGESEEQYRVCVLNRALQFDSPDKSEASDLSSTISSSVTCQGSAISSSYGDNWSIQANAGSSYTDDVEDSVEGFDDDHEENNEEKDEGGGKYAELDELCEGMRKITVEDGGETRLPEFTGKHTRFIYNSDDEIEGEERVVAEKARSPSVMVLKGLPVPQGKHLRFNEVEGEE